MTDYSVGQGAMINLDLDGETVKLPVQITGLKPILAGVRVDCLYCEELDEDSLAVVKEYIERETDAAQAA
jgi:hypothetical protein